MKTANVDTTSKKSVSSIVKDMRGEIRVIQTGVGGLWDQRDQWSNQETVGKDRLHGGYCKLRGKIPTIYRMSSVSMAGYFPFNSGIHSTSWHLLVQRTVVTVVEGKTHFYLYSPY